MITGDKIVTEKGHPKHTLVKALKEKGYSNITLAWNRALCIDRHRIGWTMKCDQIEYKRLSLDIDSSLRIINELPNITTQ